MRALDIRHTRTPYPADPSLKALATQARASCTWSTMRRTILLLTILASLAMPVLAHAASWTS